MSLKTWKMEFYGPISKARSKLAATEHSLQKWIGLRKTNLNKHGLVAKIGFRAITEEHTDDSLSVSAESCALCVRVETDWGSDCERCPLKEALGCPCDHNYPKSSPYEQWLDHRNPEPMIQALMKTKTMLQAKAK